MQEVKNLHDIEKALALIAAQTTKDMFAGLTLDRTLRLAEAAGSPHKRLSVVHIAGTSGKTSTSYMTAHLLRQAGKKVGLTVSPYVVDMRERVQLDDELLSEAAFVQYFADFQKVVQDIDFVPTYFEYMMVFALWVFDKAGVDYAVIETGLGGLLDASNICRQPNKLCIITDIGLDHVQILGNTLGEIARQKAGIIAYDNTVVMYEQGDEVMAVVREEATKNRARLVEVSPHVEDLFTTRNARLSYEAYKALSERDGLVSLNDNVIDDLSHLKVPGRLQFVQYRDRPVLLDGAHNEQKMQALTAALSSLYPKTRWSAVYAMKADKEYRSVVAEIAPLLKKVIVVPLKAGGDMPLEYIAQDELIKEFARYGVIAESAPSGEEALNKLIDEGSSTILVTGSLYLVSEIV